MRIPGLDRLWETFIRTGGVAEFAEGRHLEILRDEVAPLAGRLLDRGFIAYYSFLLHDRGSVPAPEGDTDAFVHLRFGLPEIADPDSLVAELPDCCIWTRKADAVAPRTISGLDSAKLRNGVEEAWRVLGEQSEWLVKVLAIHDPLIPARDLLPQLEQFLHFFDDMTCRQQEWNWFVQGFMSSTAEVNGERLRADRSQEEISAILQTRFHAVRQG
jgi:hypothetical protein